MKRVLLVVMVLLQMALVAAQPSSMLTQREALKTLYKATKGKMWNNNEGWMSRRPLAEWAGITCDESGNVTKIELANNNLQGRLPDIFDIFPALRKVSFRANMLEGELPPSLAKLPAKCRVDLRDNRFSTTTLYVPRHRIAPVALSIICYPQQEEYHDFRLFVDCEVDLNPTQGFRPDNYCRLYQKATEGKGIDLYVIGDGYDRAEHAVGGTADYWLERAAEAIFEIEPYNKLRSLFNVYIIYAYSPERGVGLFDNERVSRFGYWQKNPTKASNALFNKGAIFEVCKQAPHTIGVAGEAKDMYVLMVVNSTSTGLYRGMMYRRSMYDAESQSKWQLRVSLNPTNPVSFNSLVWHEFGGHCFGGLLDEYVPKKGEAERIYNGTKLSANLDTESDTKRVKWAQFIEDARYADEKIGVYRGGYNRYHNVFRATETSIMRRGGNAKLRFNAPSRAAIYTKAMSLAYPSWEFNYEEFVKFDLRPKEN